jgi:SPP1 gp7 family putative phage head morphogenesis protein
MLDADLAARVRVVESLPADAALKDLDGGDVRLADGGYGSIEFPLIEPTPDLPPIVGVFHDPEFARRDFEFLSAKQAMTADEYAGLARGYRSKAFTMSGVENEDLLAAVNDKLAEVVKAGGTEKDFERAVDDAFAEFGVDGPEAWRTNVVFDTNVRQAQSEGEWEQLHSTGVMEAFPFFRYRTRGDERVRFNHAWMNGRVYASDDPLWDEWWPPNGFNCRCWIDYISRAEAEAQGIKADAQRPEQAGIYPDDGFGAEEGLEA